MSTALVKAGEIIEEGVILAAFEHTGDVEVFGEELPDIYYMEEDEEEEVADVFTRLRSLRFSGRTGKLKDLENPDGDHRENIPGALLAKLDPGQSWFPSDGDKDWPADTWICRSHSENHPPRLNPALSVDQAAKARTLGAGSCCKTCPLKEFGDDGTPPVCGKQAQFLFFDFDLKEPCIVLAPFSSRHAVTEFVQKLKRSAKRGTGGKKRTPCLYSRAVYLGHATLKEGSQEFEVVVFSVAGVIPMEAFQQLRVVRKDSLDELEAARQRLISLAAERQPELPPAPEPEPTGSPVGRTLAPPPKNDHDAPPVVEDDEIPPCPF